LVDDARHLNDGHFRQGFVRGGLNGERRLLVYYANLCVADIIHIFDFTVINEHSQILKIFKPKNTLLEERELLDDG
jgi:hypothetical protein